MSDKSLAVYGIGNGLVDLQIKITEVELHELELDKGGMALTDEAGQQKIIDFLGGRGGEHNAGGSAANTIVGMAQMGAKVAYSCSVGKDDMGTVYWDDFEKLGIQLTTQPKQDHPTGTCLVLITPDGERTMNTCLGASAQMTPDDVDIDIVKQAEWIYVEGYLLSGDKTKAAAYAAMEAAKTNNTKIAFTFSDGFIVDAFGDAVADIVDNYADLVFANEAEAAAFSGQREPKDSLHKIIERCNNACVTMSERGSIIHYGGNHYDIPAFPATPIDLTGAGDMYAAGVLYGLTQNWPIKQAGTLGAKAAHRVVTQLGARLPGSLEALVKSLA